MCSFSNKTQPIIPGINLYVAAPRFHVADTFDVSWPN